ncbi:FGGY-family carbohydrate kinase [Saccharicrinis sp. FJH62]|uniref:FGGY-family carbohydrate kinase n=1 Tax=Saccharicrinis sp. FJH62 TaxID=3344657 RepID=UPI0035D3ED72
MMEVIVVFDIGKTNKKVLLFDKQLKLVFQQEHKFNCITDDEDFECDDIEKIESWMKDTLTSLNKKYEVKAVNFSTYGATLMYLNNEGKRLTPAYNYLKPMPEGITGPLYESYGGVAEFSRRTASPALDMLNSGLQALWLKKTKPEIFKQVEYILHFPQYLCHTLTGKVFSEYTSIGCHTALWDYDNMKYHQWCVDEELKLPEPVANETLVDAELNGLNYKCGIGIHDSSASLAPYILASKEKFVLISTGTWCINMNPFNFEPLTMDQLESDCLSFMSINRQPVKSSRLFMGHIHDVNTERLNAYFEVDPNRYKTVCCDQDVLDELDHKFGHKRHFFKEGVPSDFTDIEADLQVFDSFEEAYHKLMLDLTDVECEALSLVLTDEVKNIYVSGGFARNEIYVRQMATTFPDKTVYTSEIDNSSALGAALVVWNAISDDLPSLDLGLKRWEGFAITTK